MTTPTNEELMTQLGVTAQQAAELVQYFEVVREDIGDNMGIEYGINANGEYIKMPGGGLIVFINKITVGNPISVANGNLFSNNSETFDFPYDFISTPSVHYDVIGLRSGAWAGSGDINTTGQITSAKAFYTSATNGEPRISITAIGRWKNV